MDVIITAHPYSMQINDIDTEAHVLRLKHRNGLTSVEKSTDLNEYISKIVTVLVVSPLSNVQNLRWIRIEGISHGACT